MVSKVGSVMAGSAATNLTSQAYQTTHTATAEIHISHKLNILLSFTIKSLLIEEYWPV